MFDPHLEDLAPVSQTRQDAYNEAYKEYDEAMILWKRKQLKAVNSIKSVCENRGKNFLQGVVLVQDALDKLEEFKPKGDAFFQEVYTKWVGLSLTGCKDVDDYVEDFEDLYSRLLALDPSYSLPRVDLVVKFVNGLGPAYGSWLQSFNLTHSLTGTNGTTLSEVQGLARVEEQRLAREGAVAMVSSARAPTDRSRKRKACNGCDSKLVRSFVFDGKRRHPMLRLAIGSGDVIDAELVGARTGRFERGSGFRTLGRSGLVRVAGV